MRFLTLLLGLAFLAHAAIVPLVDNPTGAVVSRQGPGYKSVVYYVNWVDTPLPGVLGFSGIV
jgi:hypothetical protein